MKMIPFGPKPNIAAAATLADAWVRHRQAAPTKRLTIDVPLSLHQQVKSQCAFRGENMADVVRELLERQFATETDGGRGRLTLPEPETRRHGNTILRRYGKTMTQRPPPKGNHQPDLFAANFADIPIRDQRDTMERPFFSLAKKPRFNPIE